MYGYVVKLSQEPDFCPYRSLLSSGAVPFSTVGFSPKAQRIDDKTPVAAGCDAVQAVSTLPKKGFDTEKLFPDGGYYIIGCGFGTKDESSASSTAARQGTLPWQHTVMPTRWHFI